MAQAQAARRHGVNIFEEGKPMWQILLVFLVPLALALGGLGLAAFLWALKNGQFDDLDGAAWRAISDDDLPEDKR